MFALLSSSVTTVDLVTARPRCIICTCISEPIHTRCNQWVPEPLNPALRCVATRHLRATRFIQSNGIRLFFWSPFAWNQSPRRLCWTTITFAGFTLVWCPRAVSKKFDRFEGTRGATRNFISLFDLICFDTVDCFKQERAHLGAASIFCWDFATFEVFVHERINVIFAPCALYDLFDKVSPSKLHHLSTHAFDGVPFW